SVLVQVAADGGAGKVAVSSRVRALSLAPPPKAADLLGKPLPGWKEYSPRDNTFVMWVPEKPEQQEEEERNGTIDGQRMRVNSVSGKTAAGLAYEAESILLPLSFAKLPKKDALELFRGAVVKATGGRVTESKDAAVGTLSGAEYVIEARGTVTRAKIYVAGSRVYIVSVSGAPDQVSGAEAETLLLSYRLPGTTAVAKGPNDTAVMPKGGDTTVAPKGGDTAVTPKAKDPVILGHPNDPVFRDVAPAGGYLIGLEVGLGKFGPNDVIHSLRPIYRTGDKESQGERRGLETPRTVVVKAKPGYAVATVTVRAGLGLDGLSVTFMKVDGAQLDPKESYVSEWVGGPGGRAPVKLGGDGTPIVGIVGRTNGTVTNGFGVLLKGQEGFGVKKEPTVIAGGNNPLFKDVAPEGGLLIGLELGLGKFGRDDVIQAGRPIYRVGNKEQLGAQRGTNLVRVVTIKAKDGYAVGALTCKFGLNFDGCSLTFMKVKADGTLDPKDSYESEWVGYAGPKRPVKIPGDGTPVVGLAGRATGTQLHGLGLLFKGQEGFEVGSNPGGAAGNVITGGKEPYILGSIEHDPKFKTVGPAGAILVGLEVRFGKFGAIDIARAVRPIYRVNGKEEFGKQFGNDLTGSVTLRAKEGYAVGGITGKAGWWCNGFSLTFMKVKADGTLDPKDSYESEWVGFNGKGEVTRVLTDGAPAVGIVGKIVGTETTALGLLFKGQEDFDPDAKKK
ncbi:MAG: hypothetical protein J0I06_20910, partial [Planctomycetes bacterium]|nr:hypothetical protein [Planctomycetota bacterium]